MRRNENFEDQLNSSSKSCSPCTASLKNNSGKILGMGLLKYTVFW